MRTKTTAQKIAEKFNNEAESLGSAAAVLGRKGGAAGRGPAKRRGVDYAKLGRKGARRRGAIKRGFETVSSWRGHYPALIYWTVGGEIEIVFDDANTLSRPGDFAREITRPRCQDDIPGTLAAFRRLLDYVPIDEAK